MPIKYVLRTTSLLKPYVDGVEPSIPQVEMSHGMCWTCDKYQIPSSYIEGSTRQSMGIVDVLGARSRLMHYRRPEARNVCL